MNAVRNALDTKIKAQAEQQARAWLMKHLGAYSFGGEMLRSLTTLILTTQSACLEDAAKEIQKLVGKAHTYVSENADVYYAYDDGLKQAVKNLRERAAQRRTQ